MGKVTGFLEYDRAEQKYELAGDREAAAAEDLELGRAEQRNLDLDAVDELLDERRLAEGRDDPASARLRGRGRRDERAAPGRAFGGNGPGEGRPDGRSRTGRCRPRGRAGSRKCRLHDGKGQRGCRRDRGARSGNRERGGGACARNRRFA